VGKRLAVIGGGPVGLCAALAAVERGLDVAVFERGVVGQALLGWGRARLFSPFGMNVSASVRRLLGRDAPGEDALLTGPEMVENVLQPLAGREPLAGRVRTGCRVEGVARAGMTRTDFAGHPLRAERPLVLLVREEDAEQFLEFDAVLDATGVADRPCGTGPGGLPARGEQALCTRILRGLGAVENRLPVLAGRRVLLVGSGHSAANALLWLQDLARAAPGTDVTWAVRSANRRPVLEIADDPLPERRRVAASANALAESPPAWLRVERRATVTAVANRGDGLEVSLSGGRKREYDEIAALTGNRPDWRLASELPIEISPSTEGTARLARALTGVTDCLAVPAIEPADLQSGEPGFFAIGSKSYGRSRNFLLQSGLRQAEAVLSTL